MHLEGLPSTHFGIRSCIYQHFEKVIDRPTQILIGDFKVAALDGYVFERFTFLCMIWSEVFCKLFSAVVDFGRDFTFASVFVLRFLPLDGKSLQKA